MSTQTVERVEESTKTEEEIVHACCTEDVHGLFPAICGAEVVTAEKIRPTEELAVTCTLCVETMRSYRPCVACGRAIMAHWWYVA